MKLVRILFGAAEQLLVALRAASSLPRRPASQREEPRQGAALPAMLQLAQALRGKWRSASKPKGGG